MLHHFKHIVETRDAVPILGYIHLDGHRATGTDMNIWLDAPCPVEGLTEPTCVLLAPLLRIKNPSLSYKAGTLRATDGKTTLRPTQTPRVEDFPVSTATPPTHATSVLTLDHLREISCAMSTEETRYYLNGAYLHVHEGELRIVATDGHRLIWRALGDAPDGFPSVIIPRKAVTALIKMKLDIDRVELNGKYVTFHLAGDVRLTTKTIDGAYPNYQRVIPKREKLARTVQVDPKAMRDACAALAKLKYGGKGAPAKLVVWEDGMRVVARDPDMGEAVQTLPVTTHGVPDDGFEIGFSLHYIIDMCDRAESDYIFIGEDPRSPCLFFGRNVLMPYRV